MNRELTCNLEFKIEIEATLNEVTVQNAVDIISEQWAVSDGLNVNHEGVFIKNIIIVDPEIGNDINLLLEC